MNENENETVTVRVAVYGTLRRNGTLHRRWLDGACLVAEGTTDGTLRYFARHDAYPAMVAGTGDRTVVEVYAVAPEQFGPVDRMERGAGYRLAPIDVDTPAGPVTAVSWVWPSAEVDWLGDPVPGGDWIEAAFSAVG